MFSKVNFLKLLIIIIEALLLSNPGNSKDKICFIKKVFIKTDGCIFKGIVIEKGIFIPSNIFASLKFIKLTFSVIRSVSSFIKAVCL